MYLSICQVQVQVHEFARYWATYVRAFLPEIVLSGCGRHLDKAIWRLIRSNTISGFAFVDIAVYEPIKFRRHISINGWDITTSVFEKQTSAILDIYFRFRFRSLARNLHIILHQATEFHPNGSNHCGNMTSDPFLKMAAATAEYCFRFRICWCHCLQKVY